MPGGGHWPFHGQKRRHAPVPARENFICTGRANVLLTIFDQKEFIRTGYGQNPNW
jgi:hypothetical protein